MNFPPRSFVSAALAAFLILISSVRLESQQSGVLNANQYVSGGNGTVSSPWTSQSGTGGIQEAITAAGSKIGRVHLPSGWYQVDKPINATTNDQQGFGNSSPANPLIIDGDGKGKSFLVGNTGGIVIDATGRGALQFRDFTIVQGKSHPSTVGIYLSRSTARQSQYSANDIIENVYCNLPSVSVANSNRGTVCGYDYAAEGAHWINDEFNADNPLVFTGNNLFEIKSVYQPNFTGFRFISQSMVRGGFFSAIGLNTGQSILIQGEADDTSLENVTTEYRGTSVIPAIRVLAATAPESATQPIRNLAIKRLQAEAPSGQAAQMIFDTATLQSLELSGNAATVASGPPLVELNGASAKISDAEINVVPGNAGAPTPLLGDNGSATQGIKGGVIHLPASLRIAFTASSSGCQAVHFIASFDSPSITCNNKPGNFSGILASPDGITITTGKPGGNVFNANSGHTFNVQGSNALEISNTAVQVRKPLVLDQLPFSSLGTPPNGTVIYCTDCNATCTAGGGAGRTCYRENGGWTH